MITTGHHRNLSIACEPSLKVAVKCGEDKGQSLPIREIYQRG